MMVDDDGIWRCRNFELNKGDCSLIGAALLVASNRMEQEGVKGSRVVGAFGRMFKCADNGVLYDIEDDDNAEA